jgi:hypothetical protein
MAHYAQVKDGIVIQVIVAEADVLNSMPLEEGAEWIQTSFNTFLGQHRLGGTPLRKNYAGVGYIYDAELDAFYAPQPYPSWTLNTVTCGWEPPVPYPDDGIFYKWDEDTLSWVGDK